MAKYIYPAIFEKEDTLYTVRFPDLESCYTQGAILEEAYEMACDILCLTLYNLEEDRAAIAPTSDVSAIELAENEFTSLIACDTLGYRKYYDNRAVKKRSPSLHG